MGQCHIKSSMIESKIEAIKHKINVRQQEISELLIELNKAHNEREKFNARSYRIPGET